VATGVQERKRCLNTNRNPTVHHGGQKNYLHSRQTYKYRGDRARNRGPPTVTTLPSESPHPTMISALVLALVFLSSSAIASHGMVHQHRCTSKSSNTQDASTNSTNGGWCQAPSGSASFTAYAGCSHPCKLCVYCFVV
jgi:hypothetical protein